MNFARQIVIHLDVRKQIQPMRNQDKDYLKYKEDRCARNRVIGLPVRL